MKIDLENSRLRVHRPTDQRHHKALHGMTRALLNNMVVGVTKGFQKKLEVQGVGYRVDLQGDGSLSLQLGFSHPVRIAPPEGIQFEVEPRVKVITVSGIDKELWGEWRRRSALGGRRNPTKARASVMSASTFATRPAKPVKLRSR
jgi:large subunit ribosomal protein L6